MKLVLSLVETGIDGSSRSVDVLEIVGRSDPGDIAALGIALSQGKQLLGLIQREVERLRWRIWNGRAKDAQITLERIRHVMPVFHGEDSRKKDPAWRRLRKALRGIDRYLSSQSAWLINYAERHRAGLRVGIALIEATADFLVNRRMNKAQQRRWSRRGADLLLQVRCAILNGKFGSGFGQLFKAQANPACETAMAA